MNEIHTTKVFCKYTRGFYILIRIRGGGGERYPNPVEPVLFGGFGPKNCFLANQIRNCLHLTLISDYLKKYINLLIFRRDATKK